MGDFSPLKPWLEGKSTLPPFQYFETNGPVFELGAFLSLDICIPLHQVSHFPAQSLRDSWRIFQDYVQEVLRIIRVDNFDSHIDLDHEERYWVKEELGDPPKHCYPIYIVTVGSEKEEKIVYIGKTSSTVRRFSGGHRVAIKLHNPKYNGLEKKIYFGCIVFLSEAEYLPLEWIHPLDKALKILDSVESELIYYFQPELNIKKKRKNCSNYPINLNIQNFSDVSNFLDGCQI